mgnify:CR=1 FL=1
MLQVIQQRIQVLPDGRVPRMEAAAFLGRAPKTLAEWSRLGLGPKPHRVGGRVFYFLCDLQEFVASGARESK